MSTSVGTESEASSAGKPEALTVQVSRSVAAPLEHLWEVLVGPQGATALLGEGAVIGSKGEPYHCADGTWGVVRSYHPLEQLRVSWHENQDAPSSIVELDLREDGDGTVLDLRHDKIQDAALATALQARWSAALEALAQAAL
jgi:uncharacterized protein YndB with AHSA1/START domain